MSRLFIALVAAVALLGLVGSAMSGSLGTITDKYQTRLTPQEVVPTPDETSTGEGEFYAVHIKKERILHWVLRYGDLAVGPAEARIYMGEKGKNGKSLVRLCGPCRRPSRGEVRLTIAQSRTFLSRRPLYVSISTAGYPNGEIRGQLEPPKIGQGCAPC